MYLDAPVRGIYIQNCYILFNLFFYHYVMSIFVSTYNLCFKVNFVLYVLLPLHFLFTFARNNFFPLPHFSLHVFLHSNFLLFFLLYNIVLVLPYVNMNPPWVYTCSQSWTPLPPPSPYHPSGSSQCTSPKHPVSCIETGNSFLIWYYICFNAN